MSEVIDHKEELEERINANCVLRWGTGVDYRDQADLDQAYAQMIMALLVVESRDS